MRTSYGLLSLVCLAVVSQTALAQQPVIYKYTGTITSSEDGPGWFDGTYTVGNTVTGYVMFFDGGYVESTHDPAVTMLYEWFSQPNPFGAPILFPEFSINADGNDLRETLPGLFNYQVRVWNNDPNDFTGNLDGINIGAPMGPLPSFFHDFTGDPEVDPDGFLSPFGSMALQFLDAEGTALDSFALPTNGIDISLFDSVTGIVNISDFSSFQTLAEMRFEVTSFEAVPEPATFAVLGLGALALVRRRRR